MSSTSSDRNLLFGVVALQMDFIKRDQLIEAMTAWATDKSKSLGQILVEKRFLSKDRRDLLEQLADAHVAAHDNDPQMSLRALSSDDAIQQELIILPDSELHASVCRLGTGAKTDVPTRSFTAGERSSEGTRFEIRRFHAAGGLGQVFVAFDKELNREVALKEIKPERAFDANNQGRFLLEAEITGGLEHPGIVPVYGLGHYADGRPFYAMRFIRGESLYDHIKRFHESSLSGSGRNLALRELLGRFLDVCDAVQYAHDRGVLHRDLKPGNVMLGKYGETLVVDWGLAKASDKAEPHHEGEPLLSPSSGSQVPATEAGKGFGTPGYMSPEQARGEIDKLGPATDVFALGATLYCVLTGKSPIGRVKDRDPNEVELAVFQPPPARLLDASISPALEAICKKAMSVDLKDRYQNCRELGDEVRHWLADEPVSAMPEKVVAKAQRWARKNPGPVSAIAAAVLVGIVGLAGGMYLVNSERRQTIAERDAKVLALKEEQKQRERAEEKESLAQKENSEAQRQRGIAEDQRRVAKANEMTANAEKERTKRVLEFFVGAFRKPDPTMDGYKLTVASLLKQAVEQIDVKLKGEPLIQAEILAAIERTYDGLGVVADRVPIAERVHTIVEKELGPNHIKTLESMNSLAFAYKSAGQIDKAIPIYLQTMEKQKKQLGPDHASTLKTENNLACAYLSAGKTDKAIPLLRMTLKSLEPQLGPDHVDVLSVMNNLALAYRATGHLEDSLQLLVDALERSKSHLGPDHPETITTMNNLAITCESIGQSGSALSMLVETAKKTETKLGPDHPRTATTLNNLALAYRSAGQLEKALAICVDVLGKNKSKLGPEHPDTLMSMNNLASMYHEAGRLNKAIPLYLEAVQKQSSLLGQDHPSTLISMNNLANAYFSAGMINESMVLQRKTVASLQRKLGVDHPQTLKAIGNLARSFESHGQLEKALQLYTQAFEGSKSNLGLDHPDTLTAMNNLAAYYASNGQVDKALPLLKQALETTSRSVESDHLSTLASINNLAAAYRMAGQHDKAISLFVESSKRTIAKFGVEHPLSLSSQNNLANAYFSAGKTAKAIPLMLETLELQKAKLGSDHPESLLTMYSVANMLSLSGREDEAVNYFAGFVERAISKHKLIPAMVQLRVPAALDWLIFYHHKQGNKSEADKYREMRKRFPEAPKQGQRKGDSKGLPVKSPERTSPKNPESKEETKAGEAAKAPRK